MSGSEIFEAVATVVGVCAWPVVAVVALVILRGALREGKK